MDDQNKPVKGVKFNGTITNAIKPFTNEPITEFTIISGEDGFVSTEDFMINDINSHVIITLTEVEIPIQDGFRYKELDAPITIELEYLENSDGNGVLKLVNYSYEGKEDVTVIPTNDETKGVLLNVGVPNHRLIDITGKVWLEGDTYLNNKTNSAPDGIKASDEDGVSNVIVYLKNSNNDTVRKTITDENGNYEFKDIDFDWNGYYVRFRYDGVNYIETRGQGATGADSKATEGETSEDFATYRLNFNNKFHTITSGKCFKLKLYKN